MKPTNRPPPPPPPPPPPNAPKTSDSPEDDNKLLTCWYWSMGIRCAFGNDCALEHSHKGQRVALDGNILRKRQATSPRPGGRIQKIDATQAPIAGSDHARESTTVGATTRISEIARQTTEQALEPIPEEVLAKYQDFPHAREIQDKEVKLQAQIRCLSKTDLGEFQRQIREDELVLNTMCTSEDAKLSQIFTGQMSHADAEVWEAGPNDIQNEQLRNVTATLIAYSAAAISLQREFCAIIFPAKSEWSAIMKPRSKTQGDAQLCIQLRPPLSHVSNFIGTRKDGIDANSAADLHANNAVHERKYSNLPIDTLFDMTLRSDATPRVAFITHHASYNARVALLSKRLNECGIKVYHSSKAGSWDYFRRKHCNSARGSIFFHQSFPIAECKDLPQFERFLTQGRFQFFRFSDTVKSITGHSSASRSPSSFPVEEKPPEFVRLFPHGLAVYLMDDCMEDNPHDLLPALKMLGHRAKTSKSPTWILARPEIVECAARLSQSRQGEDDGVGDDVEIYKDIHTLLEELSSNDLLCKVISPPASDIPDYVRKWDRNSTEAANGIVDYFSSWSLKHAEWARRFFVLSMMKSSLRETWKRKYRHLSVMTPSDWCQEEHKNVERKRRMEGEVK
ncbi:MAG: hypothetical protein Q9162_001256 [Coniocarpon cinnabarinum]